MQPAHVVLRLNGVLRLDLSPYRQARRRTATSYERLSLRELDTAFLLWLLMTRRSSVQTTCTAWRLPLALFHADPATERLMTASSAVPGEHQASGSR